ncbi:hypothetical protein H9N28_10145 [Rhodobacter capsulatus]|uniref:hypothetical protein n=1 Tax=Rhodobacter capsulatus TaxID=1061 RepID=UPI0006DCAE89|nr:hypothetical protein [Rhodobacter capsulatus]KQB12534.1 hypothetical protein AP071_07035 [Rhodobacter capsulatus]KQB16688.1 hypothetical protein AP073_10360 [Rhodobacter capsulatus]PZX26486.1 hypothetical protein LY44_01182 [Rhodobacter capsulatus]QNR61971.1 hypothetical protein H9N28_10145 [Rhodobacter capsulatus]
MTTRPTATITLAGLRRLTGAEPGELESLIAAGTLPALDGDHLPMVQAVQAYLTHLRETARTASASAAMARARDARAEASELALAVSRRDFIPDGEAEMATDFLCGIIVDRIGGLPARVTRDRQDRRVIEAALAKAQEGIAADLAQLPD